MWQETAREQLLLCNWTWTYRQLSLGHGWSHLWGADVEVLRTEELRPHTVRALNFLCPRLPGDGRQHSESEALGQLSQAILRHPHVALVWLGFTLVSSGVVCTETGKQNGQYCAFFQNRWRLNCELHREVGTTGHPLLGNLVWRTSCRWGFTLGGVFWSWTWWYMLAVLRMLSVPARQSQWWMLAVLTPGRLRQGDCCKVEVVLGYVVSSRLTWIHSEILLQNNPTSV